MDELGNAVVHAHAGPHSTHLVGHVGQVPGLDAGHGLHLGGRLHLKNADGIGLVHSLVDSPVIEVDAAQVDIIALPLFDELQAFLHLR